MDRAKDVAKGAATKIGSSVYSIVVICLSMALTASMIGMGAAFIDDCPREKFIPVYLIVGGSMAMGLQVVLLALMICCACETAAQIVAFCIGSCSIVFGVIVTIFSFSWFIAGNVWVFRIKDDFTHESTEPTYCDSTLYWYSFWLIVVYWILMGCSCCICCCILPCIYGYRWWRREKCGKCEGVRLGTD